MKGHIYFIMWVSWAGKWTLIDNIKNQNLNLHIPLSYKSRPARDNETHWVDSYFISKDSFIDAIEAGEFLEYAVVHNSDYYGTKFEDVIENGIEQWKVVMKELDMNGFEKLLLEKPEFTGNYTTIFLDIPSSILQDRLETRGDRITWEYLKNRIASSIVESKKAQELCHHIIDATQSPEDVLHEVLSLIK